MWAGLDLNQIAEGSLWCVFPSDIPGISGRYGSSCVLMINKSNVKISKLTISQNFYTFWKLQVRQILPLCYWNDMLKKVDFVVNRKPTPQGNFDIG